MKKVLTTVALSLSALMATSAAMAAPGPGPDHRMDPRKAPPPPAHVVKQQGPQMKQPAPHLKKQDDRRFDQRAHAGKQQVNPSRDWRVGQALPKAYDSKRFQADDRDTKGLQKAQKNQSWYKINGDYVLINEKTNKIIHIVG